MGTKRGTPWRLGSDPLGLAIESLRSASRASSSDQLQDLTDDDLRELGLTIGERLRFRRAVALLGPVSDPSPAKPAVTIPERRPLTVMFVDLVGSSALSERLEPEDLLDVIRLYREFCGAAIMRYGGHIARLIGDGILAYFCYPVANENDPERAVRAGLEIVRGVGEVETPAGEPLNVRIGIATGRVIVTDLFAGGGSDRGSVTGATPNLAARLQGFAPPGGIVIAEETQARVRSLFAFEDLGEQRVRGFDLPHHAWRVLRELLHQGRLTEGPRPPRLTQFIGRQAELDVLCERWKRALRGKGGVVVVLGEAGIGKSRLIEQFLATCVNTLARVLHFAGSPFDQDSPLFPVIAHVRNAAGIEPEDLPAVKLAKLDAILTGAPEERRGILPLFAELLGIPPQAGAARPTSNPEQQREQMLQAMVDQVLALSDRQPVCLLVEDLHWLDPSTYELVTRVAEALHGRRMLLLLTARDGVEPFWTTHRDATLLRLLRLAPAEVGGMVQAVFRDRPIPQALVDQIARKTDGVPLFVEEVARSLLQRQGLAEWEAELIDEPDQAIPASLHESLMARLDRSGVAKEVAQIAAVVGRSVRRGVLLAVSETKSEELEQALATLTGSGVLQRDNADGDETYTFAHALLRDAAYDSLLRDRRKMLHLRLARALQELHPEAVEQRPELLALHLTEGGLALEAAGYWLEAGRRSLARSALTEATRLLRRGIAALERVPPGKRSASLRLQLAGLLGPALISLKGPGTPEAQELYAHAYALCRELPEEPSHFPILWGWWRVSQDYHAQLRRSEALLSRAVTRKDPEFLLQAHHCKWASHYNVAEFAACCQHVAAGLAIYHRGDYRHHARLYGNHDAKVCAHGELAQLYWMQGRLRSAIEEERQSLDWAHGLDHLGSYVHAMDFSLLHRIYRREYRHVFERAGEFVTFASEHGLADHRSRGLIFRGWTVATQEDPAGGLRTIEEGLARQRDINTSEDFPIYFCLFAEALAAAGQADRALEELSRAREDFEQAGLRVWKPEVLRTLAEMTLAADPAAVTQAQLLFTEAAELASRQGAAMLGLRVALSVARLETRLGRPAEAAMRLSQALTRVAEPEECVDIAEARVLASRLHTQLGSSCRPSVPSSPG